MIEERLRPMAGGDGGAGDRGDRRRRRELLSGGVVYRHCFGSLPRASPSARSSLCPKAAGGLSWESFPGSRAGTGTLQGERQRRSPRRAERRRRECVQAGLHVSHPRYAGSCRAGQLADRLRCRQPRYASSPRDVEASRPGGMPCSCAQGLMFVRTSSFVYRPRSGAAYRSPSAGIGRRRTARWQSRVGWPR